MPFIILTIFSFILIGCVVQTWKHKPYNGVIFVYIQSPQDIKDTLIDMANYALIALILYEEEQEYGVDKERELSKEPTEPQSYQVMAKDVPYTWPSVALNQLSTDAAYNITVGEKLANEDKTWQEDH
jgi:hypothetical protein